MCIRDRSASVGTAFKMFPVAPANIRLLLACRGFALLVVVSPHVFVGLFHDCLPIPECFGFVLCVHSGSSISNLNGQKKSGRNRRGAGNLSKRSSAAFVLFWSLQLAGVHDQKIAVLGFT